MSDTGEILFTPELISDALAELITVHDWLRFAVSKLNQAQVYLGHGTDNPWDEAAALLTHVLFLPPMTDEKLFSVRLTRVERQSFISLLKQRIEQRLPAAYLTHQAYFAGLPFYVDERVLVPRSPIAELIGAKFIRQLGGKTPQHILDLCTGSGCIAIACAYAFAEGGSAFGTNSGSGTSFVYSPAVGYAWSNGLDLGAKYEGLSKDGSNTGYVGLRLAYGFKL